GPGALGVDVDPLVVAGRVGERVDPRLVDLLPLAVAEVLTGGGPQGVGGLEDSHPSTVLSRQLRSLSDCAYYGVRTRRGIRPHGGRPYQAARPDRPVRRLPEPGLPGAPAAWRQDLQPGYVRPVHVDVPSDQGPAPEPGADRGQRDRLLTDPERVLGHAHRGAAPGPGGPDRQ